MSNPIKLGLVGIGRAGWGMHVSEIEKKPDKYQYVAACDLLPERVQKMVDKFGCKGYSNIDDMLADTDAEIVCIVNTELKPEIAEGLKTASAHYGIKAVALDNIDKLGGHPSIKGMKEIKDQVLTALDF